MNRLKLFAISLCAVMLISSCSSKKKVTTKDTSNVVSTAVATTQKARFDEAIGKNGDFKLFQARTKYSLGGKSLSGRLSIEQGKRMKLTATVLGIEVLRIDINNSQVTIVDKFDKLYTILSIDEFAAKLGLQAEMRYDAIESLFLGRMFVPGKGIAKSNDFKNLNWDILPTGDMTGEYKKDKYTLRYALDSNNNLSVTAVRLADGDKNMAISYEYADHQTFGNMQYPGTATINVNGAGTDISAKMTMSNPTEPKDWTPFSPNAEYRQVSISELFTAIKNLGK